VNDFTAEAVGAFGNDDRFELTGQTAKNRVPKTVGTWAEFDPIATVTSGNPLVWLVILIGL
jgi:hypothetical protein